MTLPPLPAIREPFPVRTPFKTAVDLYKLGKPLFDEPEDTVFVFDAAYAMQIEEKLAIMTAHPQHSMICVRDDLDGLHTTYWRVFEAAAEEHPHYITYDADGVRAHLLGVSLMRDGAVRCDGEGATYPDLGQRCANFLTGLAGSDRAGAMLALTIQEDIAITHNPTGEAYADIAEALLVALPTHWDPAEKLGLSFGKIHEPVGDNERLLKAHPKIVKAMIEGGPYVRYNWSFASMAAYSQNMALLEDHSLMKPHLSASLTPAEIVAMLYFRVERQTFLSYPDLQRGVFLIHIYQRPLADAIKSAEHGETLAVAVETMTAPQLEYRAMTHLAERLVAGLRAHAV